MLSNTFSFLTWNWFILIPSVTWSSSHYHCISLWVLVVLLLSLLLRCNVCRRQLCPLELTCHQMQCSGRWFCPPSLELLSSVHFLHSCPPLWHRHHLLICWNNSFPAVDMIPQIWGIEANSVLSGQQMKLLRPQCNSTYWLHVSDLLHDQSQLDFSEGHVNP